MRNLYWKTKDSTINLIPKEFTSEQNFESYVFENQDLLGDIVILYRQIRTGAKQGIPDMLGVDQDANVCLIEMKNNQAGEEVLPQVLGYAMWAETNPDSIKAIWLESKEKPEDIQIDWDKIEIRIIVIAPSFKPNVLKMASKINYPVDLIQIQRFSYDNDEFIFVENLEEQETQKHKITKPMEEWTWEYYEENHGKEATQEFKKVVDTINSFVKKQGWSLPYNLNKYYTGFKLGSKVVFSVTWTGSIGWRVEMKIPQDIAKSFKGEDWEFHRYDGSFRNAYFKPKSGIFNGIKEIEELLIIAYNNVSGKGK